MKNNILAIFSLLCAIILGISSAALTASLFQSFDSSWFSIVMVAIGLCNDAGKYVFSAICAFQFKREKYGSCIAYGVLAILCMSISVLASISYDLNKSKAIQNNNTAVSDSYKRQQELFKTTGDSISMLKQNIVSMRQNRTQDEDKMRADYAVQIENAKRNKLITVPGGVNDLMSQREQAIKRLDDAIQSKEAELINQEKALASINKDFENVGNELSQTRGIYNLAAWINPKNPDGTLGTINLIKNILIDIFGVAFSIGFGILISKSHMPDYFKTENHEPLTTTKLESMATGDKRRFVLARAKNQIGFKQPPKQAIDNDTIQRYVEYMRQTAKGCVSRGYRQIGSAIGIDVETARKVKAHLEQTGVVKTQGNQTIIL